MMAGNEYAFPRYLSSKKTVDDRSLNGRVWNTLKRSIVSLPSEHSLEVLEIGAGIGTMFERVFEWGLAAKFGYTALDAMPENISEACRRIPVWAGARKHSFEQTGEMSFSVIDENINSSFKLIQEDVFEFIRDESILGQWDLLIANAFLDLIDVPSALPKILRLLKPGGLFYFTINFDGGTIFEPEVDPELESKIQTFYHETMDHRVTSGRPSGDSRTGRHFFRHVLKAGASLVDAGSSDWVVFPGPDGYCEDEAYFLHFIVHTIGAALKGHPALQPEQLSAWVCQRHEQIDRGTLVYIAHQLDFLGKLA